MFKKILLGIGFVGISAALIFGAVNRTSAVYEKESSRPLALEEDNSRRSADEDFVRNERNRKDESEIQSNRRDAIEHEERIGGSQGSSQGNNEPRERGSGNRTSSDAPLYKNQDQAVAALAYSQEQLTLEGTVAHYNTDELLVNVIDGSQLIIEGRAWSFAQENGFATSPGNSLQLTGFFEGEDFETIEIKDLTTGQTVLLREESGRPLWAGRGRWN